jgi:hypothetical protein
LLPFSQKFEEGYMAYRILNFQDYSLGECVSVSLQKSDGLFLNPSLQCLAATSVKHLLEQTLKINICSWLSTTCVSRYSVPVNSEPSTLHVRHGTQTQFTHLKAHYPQHYISKQKETASMPTPVTSSLHLTIISAIIEAEKEAENNAQA